MNKLKALSIATATAMMAATASPVIAQNWQSQPEARYYQDRSTAHWYGPDGRYMGRHPVTINRHDERRWRDWQRQQDRFQRDNRSGQLVALVAGALVGHVITDRYGERRQYYRDPQSNRYYYYNYDRRSWNWDYNYRPPRNWR